MRIGRRESSEVSVKPGIQDEWNRLMEQRLYKLLIAGQERFILVFEYEIENCA
jgi:hypothetical protein